VERESWKLLYESIAPLFPQSAELLGLVKRIDLVPHAWASIGRTGLFLYAYVGTLGQCSAHYAAQEYPRM